MAAGRDRACSERRPGIPGRAYAAYIADGREIDEQAAGTPISGAVCLALPPGAYHAALYSPVSGLRSPMISMAGGQPAPVELPPFVHDVVLVIERREP